MGDPGHPPGAAAVHAAGRSGAAGRCQRASGLQLGPRDLGEVMGKSRMTVACVFWSRLLGGFGLVAVSSYDIHNVQ